jgi:hypothetical protein
MSFWEWILKTISKFKIFEKKPEIKKKRGRLKREESRRNYWDPKWSEFRRKDKNRQYCGSCKAEITCIYCNGWGKLNNEMSCKRCNGVGKRHHRCWKNNNYDFFSNFPK